MINLSSVPVPAEQGQLVVLGGVADLGAVVGEERGGRRCGGGGDAADGGAEAVADGILVPPAAAAGLRHKQP